MGFKLSKITTKYGDQGSTRLGDKTIVKKHAARVMALGSIDELNSSIGLLRVYIYHDPFQEQLITIQHHILILGSELAGTGRCAILARHVDFLEAWSAQLMTLLDPVQDFVLPQGGIAGCHCHMARTICRRAERFVVAASESDPINTVMPMQYLNRLSDILFILARVLNKHEGVAEIVLDRTL